MTNEKYVAPTPGAHPYDIFQTLRHIDLLCDVFPISLRGQQLTVSTPCIFGATYFFPPGRICSICDFVIGHSSLAIGFDLQKLTDGFLEFGLVPGFEKGFVGREAVDSSGNHQIREGSAPFVSEGLEIFLFTGLAFGGLFAAAPAGFAHEMQEVGIERIHDAEAGLMTTDAIFTRHHSPFFRSAKHGIFSVSFYLAVTPP